MSHSSEEKILSGISHLGVILGWLGAGVALLIYLTQKDKSSFTGDHAKQALGFQVAIIVVFSILGILTAGGMAGNILREGSWGVPFPPLGFGALGLLGILRLAVIIYAVVAAVNAFNGQEFKYVLIGDFVDQI